MSLYELLRRALGAPETPAHDPPSMARIEIISTAKPVKRASGSRSRPAPG